MKSEKNNKNSKLRILCISSFLTSALPGFAGVGFDDLKPMGTNGDVFDSYIDVTQHSNPVVEGNGANAGTNRTRLQAIIDYAFSKNMGVYFPSGTYLVNDQLNLTCTNSDLTNTHFLIGSATGSRPVIKITGNNFDSGPKALFYYNSAIPADGYNMVFRGIDIDLGGKAGAVGIEMHAAQGSTIQDTKITATGAYAGIQALVGSGTIHANIEIIGGKYGFYVDNNRPGSTLVGITCHDQTVRPVHFKNVNIVGPITIVGFDFKCTSGNSLFELDGSTKDREHLSLVDGKIEMSGAASTAIDNADRSIYMRNVYCKNVDKICDNALGADLLHTGAITDWTHVEDYNFFDKSGRQLINGSTNSGEYSAGLSNSNPPEDLISRHLWNESTFPHWEDSTNMVIVDSGTTGDDDSVVINAAIVAAEVAGHNTVFLKRGDYYIDYPIDLLGNTRLVGAGRSLTRIHCDAMQNNNAMITTSTADANSTCLLAWMTIKSPDGSVGQITPATWTAGRHSMVREVHFLTNDGWQLPNISVELVEITGTGGGRWYSQYFRNAQETGEDSNFRFLSINGTTEPLAIYGLCVEYCENEVYQVEINNSANVTIYCLKHESDNNHSGLTSNEDENFFRHTPALGIIDSENVLVVSQTGKGELDHGDTGNGLIEVQNSTRIQLANITAGWKGKNYAIVKELGNYSGSVHHIAKTPNKERSWPLAIYLRGTSPTTHAYTPPPSGNETVFEIEDLNNNIIASDPLINGGTYVDLSSSNASGLPSPGINHQHFKPAQNQIGAYITYEIDVVETGNYEIYLGIQERSNSPCVTLEANGVQIGNPVDFCDPGNNFVEILYGEGNLNSGSNEIKLTVHSTNASGNFCKMRLDYIKIVYLGGPLPTSLAENQEFENLTIADYSGPAPFAISNGNVIKHSSSQWNQVIFKVDFPITGNYKIYVCYLSHPNNGIVQMKKGINNLGSAVDLYGDGASIEELFCSGEYFDAGIHDIRFKVTSKNAASGGYHSRLDYIRVELE